jgi:hypothetical protein
MCEIRGQIIFDKETHRTLARTANIIHEFDPSDTETLPSYRKRLEIRTLSLEQLCQPPHLVPDELCRFTNMPARTAG